jgi:isopentenyl diphosphate isomerase/L-lactate dehydrogenase-like FMN-dependent dehydrogenase
VELTGKAEATRVEAIGLANASATEALGVARATGFEAQKEALGETATALVAVANAVSEGHITVVPEVLVTGGGGSFEGLAATLMRTFGGNGNGSGNGAAKGLGAAQPAATVDAPAPGEEIRDTDVEADAIVESKPVPPAAP